MAAKKAAEAKWGGKVRSFPAFFPSLSPLPR